MVGLTEIRSACVHCSICRYQATHPPETYMSSSFNCQDGFQVRRHPPHTALSSGWWSVGGALLQVVGASLDGRGTNRVDGKQRTNSPLRDMENILSVTLGTKLGGGYRRGRM